MAACADSDSGGGSRNGNAPYDPFGNAAAGVGGAAVIPGGDTGGTMSSRPRPPLNGAGGSANGECAATAAEAEVGREPADIVWIVDNSCSMAVEAVAVQTNMNRFAQKLVDSGIDVHLVLISSANTAYQMNTACPPDDLACAITMLVSAFVDFGVCIGAPFGSGMCPEDSKQPNFMHLAIPVGSTNGLQMAVDLYPQYASMMRPNASKHFAIISDDNSDMDAATFTQRVNALDPALFAKWRYHGIFTFTDCPDSAEVGTVHQELVKQTGGVSGDLCTQMFDPVFDALAMNVVTQAEVACDWPIPPAPAGMSLDSTKINVNFTQPNGTKVSLGRIPTGEMCEGREGWYYDNDTAPTKVLSCPASCERFKAGGGKVDVLFGCTSVEVM
ncbi:MAG TPA: hypothetical protein VK509_06435 [Polyangiales bacterium]|nr:hypothetical protein [Polyangiales bacterium]